MRANGNKVPTQKATNGVKLFTLSLTKNQHSFTHIHTNRERKRPHSRQLISNAGHKLSAFQPRIVKIKINSYQKPQITWVLALE